MLLDPSRNPSKGKWGFWAEAKRGTNAGRKLSEREARDVVAHRTAFPQAFPFAFGRFKEPSYLTIRYDFIISFPIRRDSTLVRLRLDEMRFGFDGISIDKPSMASFRVRPMPPIREVILFRPPKIGDSG
jgi:hypothetical protein